MSVQEAESLGPGTAWGEGPQRIEGWPQKMWTLNGIQRQEEIFFPGCHGSWGEPKSCRASQGQGQMAPVPHTLETLEAWLGGWVSGCKLLVPALWGLVPITQV